MGWSGGAGEGGVLASVVLLLPGQALPGPRWEVWGLRQPRLSEAPKSGAASAEPSRARIRPLGPGAPSGGRAGAAAPQRALPGVVPAASVVTHVLHSHAAPDAQHEALDVALVGAAHDAEVAPLSPGWAPRVGRRLGMRRSREEGNWSGGRGQEARGKVTAAAGHAAQGLTQYLSVLPSGSVSSPHLRGRAGGGRALIHLLSGAPAPRPSLPRPLLPLVTWVHPQDSLSLSAPPSISTSLIPCTCARCGDGPKRTAGGGSRKGGKLGLHPPGIHIPATSSLGPHTSACPPSSPGEGWGAGGGVYVQSTFHWSDY